MKIERIETLHADAAWRNFDFLKVTTDNGIVGWSEYNESFGGRGVTQLIENIAPLLIGQDPRRFEAHAAWLYARGRPSQGGITRQALAAVAHYAWMGYRGQREGRQRASGKTCRLDHAHRGIPFLKCICIRSRSCQSGER